jgi:protein-disulfide isomerase
MSVPPKFAGLKLSAGRSLETQHTLELYLDYVCPFSAKMFNTFYTLSPIISQQYGPRLQVIFRQHIQPWHPSSTLTHEAGAAVLRLAPEKFWDFSSALFERQTEFFDVSLVNETRNKTYERLAKVAGSVGLDESKVLDLLKVSESPGEEGQLNIGNQVTNDIKLMVKADRVVGVHVSPTVFFNVRGMTLGKWFPTY